MGVEGIDRIIEVWLGKQRDCIHRHLVQSRDLLNGRRYDDAVGLQTGAGRQEANLVLHIISPEIGPAGPLLPIGVFLLKLPHSR